MIYSPRGYVVSKAVADPDKLGRELLEPYRVASATSQWNWGLAAFTDIDDIEDDQSVFVDTVAVAVDDDPPFQSGDMDEYPTDLDGTDGVWQIPFNSSYMDVGDGDMALTWTSSYQELVWFSFSFQYTRAGLLVLSGLGVFADPLMHRLRLQLQVDGALIQGTGPYSNQENAFTRGSGSQERTLAHTVNCAMLLQAGTHRVTPVACLGPSIYSDRPFDAGDHDYVTNEVDALDYAAIGNRRMTVIRFAKGGWLGR